MSKIKMPEVVETEEANIGEEKTPISKNPQKKKAEKVEYKVIKSLDPNMYVTVRNGFQGLLIYKSPRTHESYRWDEFGAEQDISLQELKNAKSSSKNFFVNNWFLIDDPEIIEYLGVTKYYENALKYDSFDELFSKEPDEIKEVVSKLSKGQKKSVAYRSKQLIANKAIDSIRVIDALEESLSIDLIER